METSGITHRQSISESLAAQARELWTTGLDPAVDVETRRRIVDTVACCVAGTRSDIAPALTSIGAVPADEAHAFGLGTTTVVEASFINGTLAHALDFDDTLLDCAIHAGCVIVPAAVAVAELVSAPVEDLVRAVACGYEVVGALGRHLNAVPDKAHHMRGFHSTATCGVFAAAASAALLMDLDEAEVANVLGIAASSAAGLMQCVAEGSSVKRAQAGLAASGGARAALLGRAGFTGPREVFEGRFGFWSAYGADASRPWAPAPFAEGRGVLSAATKLSPVCHHNIPVIACVQTLAQQDRLPELADIEEIVVRQPPAAHAVNAEPRDARVTPRNLLDAQMSVHYAVAATLLRGDADLASLIDEFWRDPELLDVTRRIRSVPDEALGEEFSDEIWPAVVSVRTSRGTVEQKETTPPGFPRRRATPDQLLAKGTEAATIAPDVCDEDQIRQAADAILDPDRRASTRGVVGSLLDR